jgi:hypothetical protein
LETFRDHGFKDLSLKKSIICAYFFTTEIILHQWNQMLGSSQAFLEPHLWGHRVNLLNFGETAICIKVFVFHVQLISRISTNKKKIKILQVAFPHVSFKGYCRHRIPNCKRRCALSVDVAAYKSQSVAVFPFSGGWHVQGRSPRHLHLFRHSFIERRPANFAFCLAAGFLCRQPLTASLQIAKLVK